MIVGINSQLKCQIFLIAETKTTSTADQNNNETNFSPLEPIDHLTQLITLHFGNKDLINKIQWHHSK